MLDKISGVSTAKLNLDKDSTSNYVGTNNKYGKNGGTEYTTSEKIVKGVYTFTTGGVGGSNGWVAGA